MSDAGGVNTDALLRLAVRHRVVGLFHARLQAELPPGLPRLFLAGLRFVRHEQEKRFREQITSAQTFAERFGTPDAPIIFLKGFGAYALTGDEARRRPVGDFDVIAPDSAESYETLLANNFYGKRHFTHEYGKLSDGAATIDLHDYFPVRGYPATGWNADAVTALPETFTRHELPDLSPDFAESAIRYADLLAYSRRGVAPGTEGLTFPAPEMACLLLRAHAFRDATVTLHYMADESLLCLGELADADALARLPDFDAALFAELVSRFNGADSVSWTARQIMRFFSASVLPHDFTDKNRTARTIEHLPMGGWVYLGEPALSLRSGEDVLARFVVPTVDLTVSGDVAIAPTPILSRGTAPGLCLRVARRESRITFTWRSDAPITELRLLFRGSD